MIRNKEFRYIFCLAHPMSAGTTYIPNFLSGKTLHFQDNKICRNLISLECILYIEKFRKPLDKLPNLDYLPKSS